MTITCALCTAAGKAELPPCSTQAVSALRALIQKRGAAVMTQSLGVLAEAYPSQPNQLRGAMIGAVTELLARRGDQVDRARLVKVLTERDADELAVAATAAKQLLNCSTTEARVEALKRDYAKGLPDTRCPSAVRISEVAATRPEEPANAFISPPSKLRLMAGR